MGHSQTNLKKKPSDQTVDITLERFSRSLSLGNASAALRLVESFFRRYPNEPDTFFSYTLKRHLAFQTPEFQKQVSAARERGRIKAKQSVSERSDEVQEGV